MNWLTGLTFSMIFLCLSSQYGNTAEIYLSPSVVSTGLLAPVLGPFRQHLKPAAVSAAAASLSDTVATRFNLLPDHGFVEPQLSSSDPTTAAVLSELESGPLGLLKPAAELYEPYLSSSASQVAAARALLNSVAKTYVQLGSSQPLVPIVRSYGPYIKSVATGLKPYGETGHFVPLAPTLRDALVSPKRSVGPYASYIISILAAPEAAAKSKPFGSSNTVPVVSRPLSSLDEVPAAVASSDLAPILYGPIQSVSVPYSSFKSDNLLRKPLGLTLSRFVPLKSVDAAAKAELYDSTRPIVPVYKYLGPFLRLSSAALASSLEVPRAVPPVASGHSSPGVSSLLPLSSIVAKPFGPPGPIAPAAAPVYKHLEPFSRLSSAVLVPPSLAVQRAVLPVAPAVSSFPPQSSIEAKPFGPPAPIVPSVVPSVVPASEYFGPHSSLSSEALASPPLAVQQQLALMVHALPITYVQ